MWGLFRSKPILSEEDQWFQVECYKWLLSNFGGDHFYKNTKLVLPTKEFFPSKVNSNEDAAKITFEQVRKHAGLQDWPCKLVAQKKDPNFKVAPTVILQNTKSSPLGTFSGKKKKVTITYNPDIVSNPTQMVATFAHELSHYLTFTASEPPPGGADNWEFATDVCATFLGFGIFVANSAFVFQQYSSTGVGTHGWESSRNGYLSEAEHSYALAIFLLLKEVPPEQAYPHCDTNIKSCLKRAVKELNKSEIIKELQAVEYKVY